MKTIRSLLLAAVAFAAIAFVSPPVAHAADEPRLSALTMDFTPLPLMAAAESPISADTPTVAAPADVPFWQDGAVIGGFIAFITSILSIWSQTKLTSAQKINKSLIVGIETATKIPSIAEHEKRIKRIITESAEEYGVQPVLDLLVRDLTKKPDHA